MSTFVLIGGQGKPDKIADIKSWMTEVLPHGRSYDGCQGVDALFNMDDPGNFVVMQQWESRGHYEKYLQWRSDTGGVARLVSMLTEPPSIRYFEKADV